MKLKKNGENDSFYVKCSVFKPILNGSVKIEAKKKRR